MQNIADKRNFIKANNSLIKGENLTALKRNALTEEQCDSLIEKIKAHPKYSEQTPTAPVVETTNETQPLQLDGVVASEEFGNLLHLPFIGMSAKSFKFQYGTEMVYCNDNTLFLLQEHGKVEVGNVFAFKADTLKLDKNNKFTIRLNYTADAVITEANSKVAEFQSKREAMVKSHAKVYGKTYTEAKAYIDGILMEEDTANIKAKLPKFSL